MDPSDISPPRSDVGAAIQGSGHLCSRCLATIEPSTPDVRDGRANYVCGWNAGWVTDPPYVGVGTPLPRGGRHLSSVR